MKLKVKSVYEAYKADADGLAEMYDKGYVSQTLPKEQFIRNSLASTNPIRLSSQSNVGLMPGNYIVIQLDPETHMWTGCVAFEREAEMLEFFEDV